MKTISTLKPHQVFVFGSNSTGFHGAGAAGYACRGTSANTWRSDPWFEKARKSPIGSPDRVGKWAVYGVARGLQQGLESKSYAIVTIVQPGLKRSVPLEEIEAQISTLLELAHRRADLEFLMTPIGANLAGYTAAEMADTLQRALLKQPAPKNIIIPEDLYNH